MENIEVIETGTTTRIVRVPDRYYVMEWLKGDCFNPEVNDDIPVEKLRQEEREFERRVEVEGVWGYLVQKWNPEVGIGWETIDSIWGFVGEDFHGSEAEDEFKALLDWYLGPLT